MKVIIAGSRDITDPFFVSRALKESGFIPMEIVSGCCRGVDRLGEQLADVLRIPIKRFPPDWQQYGPAAGPIRNVAMAEYSDALILVWDGKSKGSANMLMNAKRRYLQIYEKIVQPCSDGSSSS